MTEYINLGILDHFRHFYAIPNQEWQSQ